MYVPPHALNRVSQHGIKLPLEIFKTKNKGWGVRCRNPIPIGTFVCEYCGELIDEEEAERRVGRDNYLFDIGLKTKDSTVSYTLDAANYGNIGRFINHSCRPNLCAIHILYDHDDETMTHIMLYATEDIGALIELTLDYKYTIGSVVDDKGLEKKIPCHCGAYECRGRIL